MDLQFFNNVLNGSTDLAVFTVQCTITYFKEIKV